MRDDERADLLYHALVDGEPLPDAIDDAELEALLELGTELRLHAATISLIEEADARFTPAFSRQLRGELAAAHPASARPASASERATPVRAASAVSRRSRQLWRRLIAGATLLAALAAVAIIAIAQSSRPATQVGLAAFTATVSQPRILASQPSADAAAPTGGAASSHNGVKGVATPSAAVSIMQTYGLDQTRKTPTAVHAKLFAPTAAATKPAPPVSFRLPARLAAFPRTARIYSMHYDTLTSAALARIAASFPNMKPSTSGQYRSPKGDSLVLARATGEVQFVSGHSAPHASGAVGVAPATAERLARAWLALHGLLSATVVGARVTVSTTQGISTVRFTPALAFPLADDRASVDITVALAHDGRVVRAHRLWPMLALDGTVSLATPAAAATQSQALPATAEGARNGTSSVVPNRTATASRVVRVDGVALVYAIVGAGPSRSLQPFYRFQGRPLGPNGVRQDMTYLLPAARAPTP